MTGVKVWTPRRSPRLIFGEPEGEAVAERLAASWLTAPSLLEYQLANVCLVKIRRDPSQRQALLAAHEMAS